MSDNNDTPVGVLTDAASPIRTVIRIPEAEIAEMSAHVQTVDWCRRLLARRGARLEITICTVSGDEVTEYPPAEPVTACALAVFPDGREIAGVTDPIAPAAFAGVGVSTAALSAAVHDLIGQIRLHPSEVWS